MVSRGVERDDVGLDFYTWIDISTPPQPCIGWNELALAGPLLRELVSGSSVLCRPGSLMNSMSRTSRYSFRGLIVRGPFGSGYRRYLHTFVVIILGGEVDDPAATFTTS